MDSYEWNKIAGWVLAAAVAILGLSILTGYVFNPKPLAKPAYVVEGVEVEASAEAPAAEAEKPIAFYLATADAARGEAQFKKCAACHTIEKGGKNGIGPNLWGVKGLSHAHMAGFGYSDAMLATKGKIWDWDSMNQWIKAPKAYIPGNKMSFAGLSKPQDRADILVYMNKMSDNPQPLPPVPAEAAAPAEAAPAEAAAADAAPAAEAAPAEAAAK
ncbi:c-type cytochrome [Sandaracinobacteroides saxicola]|uniref:Cytochrome c family protein n=1 Tax=Sandaracinobacteroides saxicola TaxID=2759707 RepID=A0A7G5IKZ6_9SPHN|nr:cytochrome c family protein [Sandaracinobacteroides saxicola]QMW24038.1 cytochrome c family protein [Sandaracinobacteroides saxicola]